MKRPKIALIGSGQMAEALIGGFLAAKATEPGDLFATDVCEARRDLIKRRFGIRVGSDNAEAAAWADVALLAVKPQVLDAVLEFLGQTLAGRIVVSIVAGVPISRIADRLHGGARVVRVMPNMPAVVREAVSALVFGPGIGPEEKALVTTLFESVGRVVIVEELWMDAVTGLSGSGPAYVFLAIEALADGGVKMGLPRAVAETLAAQTVLGAARMALETGEHLGRLKDQVASPGGTTIAGLQALEQAGFRASLMSAVEAATRRSIELRG